MNEKIKLIFLGIGAIISGIVVFIFGRSTGSGKHDRQRNISGIDEQLRIQGDISKRERVDIEREREELREERARIRSERDLDKKSRGLAKQERRIIDRDKLLLAELKKRQEE